VHLKRSSYLHSKYLVCSDCSTIRMVTTVSLRVQSYLKSRFSAVTEPPGRGGSAVSALLTESCVQGSNPRTA
jgi:hypothetical protein